MLNWGIMLNRLETNWCVVLLVLNRLEILKKCVTGSFYGEFLRGVSTGIFIVDFFNNDAGYYLRWIVGFGVLWRCP